MVCLVFLTFLFNCLLLNSPLFILTYHFEKILNWWLDRKIGTCLAREFVAGGSSVSKLINLEQNIAHALVLKVPFFTPWPNRAVTFLVYCVNESIASVWPFIARVCCLISGSLLPLMRTPTDLILCDKVSRSILDSMLVHDANTSIQEIFDHPCDLPHFKPCGIRQWSPSFLL